jgi:Tfp pilus assembly protein PilO
VAKAPNSLLQREDADYTDYIEILENSKTTVTQLNDVVVKFKCLGLSRKINWDRLRLANRNLDEIRSKLTLHVSLLSAYLDIINVSSLGRIERDARDLPKMKDTIDNLLLT